MSKLAERFVVCIDNSSDDDMDLQLHKVYRVIDDPSAEADGDLRIVDDSGEDYLYSAHRFVAIDVPEVLRQSLLAKAS